MVLTVAWDAVAVADTGTRIKGTVESCSFATQSLPPPFRVGKPFAEGHWLFQAAGPFVPEQITVKSVVLLGSSRIGLNRESADRLYGNLDQVYRDISKDPLLQKIPSALPYCLADRRPAQGHYFAYYPTTIAENTPVIVFLHGFGGNFLFYTHLLKEEFPDAVILVPSWSGSWYDGTMQYLEDMYQDVRRRMPVSIGRPWLMAISAGGPAGFRLYQERPQSFSCLVSIASAPPRAVVPKLRNDSEIFMINGKDDLGFRIAAVESIAAQLSARLPRFRLHVVDGDHYFLLSHREETFREIKAFLRSEARRR